MISVFIHTETVHLRLTVISDTNVIHKIANHWLIKNPISDKYNLFYFYLHMFM